jgi:hypothetical protein
LILKFWGGGEVTWLIEDELNEWRLVIDKRKAFSNG